MKSLALFLLHLRQPCCFFTPSHAEHVTMYVLVALVISLSCTIIPSTALHSRALQPLLTENLSLKYEHGRRSLFRRKSLDQSLAPTEPDTSEALQQRVSRNLQEYLREVEGFRWLVQGWQRGFSQHNPADLGLMDQLREVGEAGDNSTYRRHLESIDRLKAQFQRIQRHYGINMELDRAILAAANEAYQLLHGCSWELFRPAPSP